MLAGDRKAAFTIPNLLAIMRPNVGFETKTKDNVRKTYYLLLSFGLAIYASA